MSAFGSDGHEIFGRWEASERWVPTSEALIGGLR
jgi:hypothetical protein